VVSLVLAPNLYHLFLAGGSESWAFRVRPDGTLDFDPLLDGILFGRGTQLLEFGGAFPISFERARHRRSDLLRIAGFDSYPREVIVTLRLVPNVYRIFFAGGATASPSR